jgi:hypothetical protein
MVSKLSREDVLAGVDVLRTLGMLGVIVTKAGSQWADCRCPLHQDTNPSFRVALEANGEHEKGFWMCMAEFKKQNRVTVQRMRYLTLLEMRKAG